MIPMWYDIHIFHMIVIFHYITISQLLINIVYVSPCWIVLSDFTIQKHELYTFIVYYALSTQHVTITKEYTSSVQ